jgi:hypothetical protein
VRFADGSIKAHHHATARQPPASLLSPRVLPVELFETEVGLVGGLCDLPVTPFAKLSSNLRSMRHDQPAAMPADVANGLLVFLTPQCF